MVKYMYFAVNPACLQIHENSPKTKSNQTVLQGSAGSIKGPKF